MRLLLFCFLLGFSSISFAQDDQLRSTMEFVEILDGNREEAIYYYENNWAVFREMAIDSGYIDSYQLLETSGNGTGPSFHLILVTTYPNIEMYNKREEHFQGLIKRLGPLKLLNDKKPGDFRTTVFTREPVSHVR